MEIRDFVTNVLKDILEGTKSASDERYKFRIAYREGKGIFFDIAVMASEEKTGGKGIGGNIKVVAGGATSSNKSSSENISRVQFNVECIDIHLRDATEKQAIRRENALKGYGKI